MSDPTYCKDCCDGVNGQRRLCQYHAATEAMVAALAEIAMFSDHVIGKDGKHAQYCPPCRALPPLDAAGVQLSVIRYCGRPERETHE